MSNINNITSQQILSFLVKQGFVVHHQKGSHVQLKKENLRVTVPDWGKRTLNIRTVLSILHQSQTDKNTFLNSI